MCSASACEHCWSIEGWIHSKRRNTVTQELVESKVWNSNSFSHPVNFLAWRSRRRAVHVWHIVHGRTPASTWCVAAAPIAPPIRRRIVRSRLRVSAVHWPATIRRAGRHWSVRLRILHRCWARGIRRGVTAVRRGIVGHPSPASRRGVQTRVISALHLPGFQPNLCVFYEDPGFELFFIFRGFFVRGG